MDIDLFEIVADLHDDDLHPKYLLLRDNALFLSEKKIISAWAKDFQDRDNKIRKEFQTTFHSTFWELYLYQVLKSLGLNIDWRKNRPDFISDNPIKIYFEAVVSEIKENGRPESTRGFDDIFSMLEPPWKDLNYDEMMTEAITRYSNSILGKREKYHLKYSKLDWISSEVPFVIAMSSYSQVRYGKEYLYPMMALLYGRYFDPKSMEFTNKREILKPGTKSIIPLGIFQKEEMKCVSAVLFSCTVTLGKLAALAISKPEIGHLSNDVFLVRHDYEPPHYRIQEVSPGNPEDLFDGLFVFHNPNAVNKLPKSLFEPTSTIQVWESHDGFHIEGGDRPLVARMNISRKFVPENFKKILLKDVFTRFNSE